MLSPRGSRTSKLSGGIGALFCCGRDRGHRQEEGGGARCEHRGGEVDAEDEGVDGLKNPAISFSFGLPYFKPLDPGDTV